jgi:hypothetical protein
MLHNLFAYLNVLLPHFTIHCFLKCFIYPLPFHIHYWCSGSLCGLTYGVWLGWMFSWLVLGCWSIVIPLHLLWNTCNIMDSPFLLALASSWRVDNTLPLLKVYLYSSWNLPKRIKLC